MNKKQTAFILAKIAFASTILFWIFHKVDGARVWGCVRYAKPSSIITGVLCCWLCVGLAGWRWHRLLRVFEITMPLWTLVAIAQIGQFFLMFLPGPAGDDLTRMLYIARFTKGRIGEACTTVLLDRCIGLASILLLALAAVPLQWKLLATTPQTRWMAVGLVGGGCLVFISGLVFLLTAPAVSKQFLDFFISKIPKEKLREELARMSSLLSENKQSIAMVVLVALGTQLLVCVTYVMAGIAVGIHASPLVWVSFLPIILAANAIPITIAGAGIREYLMVLFLGTLAGVETERALAASLIAFAMMLAVCLIGGVVYIFFKPSQKSESPQLLSLE